MTKKRKLSVCSGDVGRSERLRWKRLLESFSVHGVKSQFDSRHGTTNQPHGLKRDVGSRSAAKWSKAYSSMPTPSSLSQTSFAVMLESGCFSHLRPIRLQNPWKRRIVKGNLTGLCGFPRPSNPHCCTLATREADLCSDFSGRLRLPLTSVLPVSWCV
jgi:hypothetical protein